MLTMIARAIGLATMLASTVGIALLLLGYPRLQGVISPSAVERAGANSYTVQLAEPTGWAGVFQLVTDGPDDPRASSLMVYENGVALGPAHTSLVEIASGRGAFSHWGGKLYFSSTAGEDPRSNGNQYLVVAPYTPAGWVIPSLVAVALISLVVVLAFTPAQMRRQALASSARIGPSILYAATGAGIVVWLVVSCFNLREATDLSVSSIRPAGGHAYVAHVAFRSTLSPFLEAATENVGGASSLAVVLTEDGRPLSMPQAYVHNIQGSGTARYGFYDGQVYFAPSDNSDPRTNGRTYAVESRLVFPLFLQIAVSVLAAASLVLVARKRPAIVCGALATTALATAVSGILSYFDLVSHEEVVSRANVSHSIDQSYAFQVTGSVAPFIGMAPVGTQTKIKFGDLVVYCQLKPGSLHHLANSGDGACAPRSSGTTIDVVFPAAAKSGVDVFLYAYPVRVHPYLVALTLIVGVIFALIAYFRPPARHIWIGSGTLVSVVGLLLISANIAGVFLSLRVEMPTERVEGIRMGPPRLPLELARAKLLWSKTDTPESYATRANQTIHDSMINGDVTTDLSRWRLEIPVWENWVLHGLGVIEPKLRSYRFWDYHKEFERGIGLCGHLSTILVGYLEANGVPARMVGLSGHMIVTAEVAPGVWYLFDPDYGVVIPHALEVVENSQELIEAAYAAEDDATLRAIINYYASKTDNSVDSTGRGGFYTSWGDTAEEYSVRENLANILKWVVPVSLVLFGACILVLTFLGGRRQRRRPRGVVPQG